MISDKRLFELAAELLELAGDKFGNHTCNDFNLPGWSPAERRQLAIEYEQYNGDAEEAARLESLPVGDPEFEYFSDFCLMFYASYRLEKMGRDLVSEQDDPVNEQGDRVWKSKAFIEYRQAMGELIHVRCDGVTYTGTVMQFGNGAFFKDALPAKAIGLLSAYEEGEE